MRVTAKNLAANRGFSRGRNLMVPLKFTTDRPLLPWQRKFGNFNTKSYNSVYVRDNSQNLAPAAGFGVMQYNRVTEVCLRPTLVTMVTKTRELLHKISYDSVYITGIAENPAPNGGFRDCAI